MRVPTSTASSTRLATGEYDCVTAGTTVTPEREKKARFVPPYLISGQSLAVDTNRGCRTSGRSMTSTA